LAGELPALARSLKQQETHAVAQPVVTLSEHELQLQERLREEIALRKLQNAVLEARVGDQGWEGTKD